MNTDRSDKPDAQRLLEAAKSLNNVCRELMNVADTLQSLGIEQAYVVRDTAAALDVVVSRVPKQEVVAKEDGTGSSSARIREYEDKIEELEKLVANTKTPPDLRINARKSLSAYRGHLVRLNAQTQAATDQKGTVRWKAQTKSQRQY